MTSQVRQHLREAIDAHKRERLAAARQANPYTTCPGCDSDQDTYTRGCKRCYDRKRRHRRRDAKAAA